MIASAAVAGLVIGALVVWLWHATRANADRAALAAARSASDALAQTLAQAQTALADERARATALEARAFEAERGATEASTRLAAEREAFEHARADIEERTKHVFEELAQKSLGSASETFLKLAQERLGKVQADAQGGLNTALAPIKAEFEKFQQAVTALQNKSAEGFGTLKTSLEQMATLQHQLRQAVSSTNEATGKLRDALNNPKHAGSWGEITLRRIVEMAGMTEHCDFDEQTGMTSTEGTQERPDMTIHLTGDLRIPVDAKAPVVRYLEACNAEDDAERKRLLRESAQSLRDRVKEVKDGRAYHRIPGYAGMTIVFVPNESMLSSALAEEPQLVEEAAASRIVVCSPLLLLCYLHAFARGWSLQKQQSNAEEIARLGQSLHDRLSGFFAAFGKVGAALGAVTDRFNVAAGTLNNLVVPGRKLGELLGKQSALQALDEIEKIPRSVRSGNGVKALPEELPLALDEGAETGAAAQAGAGAQADPNATGAPPALRP